MASIVRARLHRKYARWRRNGQNDRNDPTCFEQPSPWNRRFLGPRFFRNLFIHTVNSADSCRHFLQACVPNPGSPPYLMSRAWSIRILFITSISLTANRPSFMSRTSRSPSLIPSCRYASRSKKSVHSDRLTRIGDTFRDRQVHLPEPSAKRPRPGWITKI